MNGSSSMVEPVVVPDLALAEKLITIPMESSGRTEFRAGVSSRSRVLVDYDFPQAEKEKRCEMDFYLAPGACVDVFHVLTGDAARCHVKRSRPC